MGTDPTSRDGFQCVGTDTAKKGGFKGEVQILRRKDRYQGKGTDTKEKERIPMRRNGYQGEGTDIKMKGRKPRRRDGIPRSRDGYQG